MSSLEVKQSVHVWENYYSDLHWCPDCWKNYC